MSRGHGLEEFWLDQMGEWESVQVEFVWHKAPEYPSLHIHKKTRLPASFSSYKNVIFKDNYLTVNDICDNIYFE